MGANIPKERWIFKNKLAPCYEEDELKQRSQSSSRSQTSFKMEANSTCHKLLSFIILSFFTISLVYGKTLVLLDNPSIKETHSIFFNNLKGEFIPRRL